MDLLSTILLLILGVSFLYYERELIRLGFRSYSYKSTTGTIIDSADSSFTTSGLAGTGGFGIGEVSWKDRSYIYEYKVADKIYHCDNYCLGGWAARLAVCYKIGDTVTVYYNPKNPKEAVLKRGPTLGMLFGIIPILIAFWRIIRCWT